MLNPSDRQFYHFSNRNAGFVMSFVGGYVDALGYMLLYTLFVASITGNVVKFAISASQQEFATGYFVVTIAFGFGGALTNKYLISTWFLFSYV